MHKSRCVPNPQYRAIPINWRLHLQKPLTDHVQAGELELSFKSTDEVGRRTEFKFPCAVSGKGCHVTTTGIVRKIDLEGRCISEHGFSIAGRMQKDPGNKFLVVFNSIIEAVARNCGQAFSSIREFVSSIDGTLIIPPALMRIPKRVSVTEVSYEELVESGQLDPGIEKFCL